MNDIQLNNPLNKEEKTKKKTPLEITKKQAEQRGFIRVKDKWVKAFVNGIKLELDNNGCVVFYELAGGYAPENVYNKIKIRTVYSLAELNTLITDTKNSITKWTLLDLGFKKDSVGNYKFPNGVNTILYSTANREISIYRNDKKEEVYLWDEIPLDVRTIQQLEFLIKISKSN